ncbi:MAG: TMEM165/GDT1 family protein [Eubacteriales bacterium]
MDQTLLAIIFSVSAVTLAEMGDKTQLLAMAFATKFKARQVLIGVFLATIFNHALAVALGTFITRYENLNIFIQVVAAISFIGFGLWTIRGDKLEGEENRISKFGPVATVAIAFFLAEMGDKTQLTTIALATKFPGQPFQVLLGTTTGMLIADGIGIIIGVVLCKKIPDRIIKLASAAIFIIFGFASTYQSAIKYLNFSTVGAILLVLTIAIATGFIAFRLIDNERKRQKAEARDNKNYCEIKENMDI